ncbi:unnamed protein product [Gadus morhua 'NCC']
MKQLCHDLLLNRTLILSPSMLPLWGLELPPPPGSSLAGPGATTTTRLLSGWPWSYHHHQAPLWLALELPPPPGSSLAGPGRFLRTKGGGVVFTDSRCEAEELQRGTFHRPRDADPKPSKLPNPQENP